MAKYSEQMQRIFDRYTAAVDSSPVSLDHVAAWAIQNGLWKPAPRDVVKLCMEDLAESLRQEKRTDAKGRRYRAKHSVRINENGLQLTLWADIDSAPRSFMEESFAQRRTGIVNNCFQIKQDIDHFHDEHSGGQPIQMILDFTDDVAELEAATRMSKSDDEAA
ncbi:hypothetical protein JYK14_27340 [Siccirubricoccus sp. KC 17139]|uniref:Uncharacterized protein n=1 Tax=Siccirubricoccus soli TaxID=2899147 RepID=A0ABT1DD35_9PROT|nr:hypothetical protein [Siccirubricoccus soli]MCO6419848.1 hypothetical protein [Siccirubricoccus soli]MCP2685983.1 hypothetical protein [Siccirubricoccus soli]